MLMCTLFEGGSEKEYVDNYGLPIRMHVAIMVVLFLNPLYVEQSFYTHEGEMPEM